jgi:hypothetical protein
MPDRRRLLHMVQIGRTSMAPLLAPGRRAAQRLLFNRYGQVSCAADPMTFDPPGIRPLAMPRDNNDVKRKYGRERAAGRNSCRVATASGWNERCF